MKFVIAIFDDMRNRTSKIFMLYLAALFLLGHNFISHHHPEDHIEFSHSQQDEHQDTDKDEDSLSSIFSQSQHQNTTKEIQVSVKSSDSIQFKQNNCFISEAVYAFGAISRILRIDDPPKKIVGHVFSYPPSQISFRGPPTLV